MNSYKYYKLALAMLALTWLAPAGHAQAIPPSTSSAVSSPPSATAAGEFKVQSSKFRVRGVGKEVAACNATVDELKASRALIDALDRENSSLRSAIETGRPSASENPTAPSASPSRVTRSVTQSSPMRAMAVRRCTCARKVRDTAGPVLRKST